MLHSHTHTHTHTPPRTIRALSLSLSYACNYVVPGPPKVKRYEELDCKDEEVGLTALMWACKGGYYECARLLHESGASIDLKSDEGKTALQYAKEFKKEDIIKWFERGCEELPEIEEEV